MSHKVPVNTADIINSFQALAAQIGPKFSYHDARRAEIWGAHLSRKTGLTFNDVKELAGLPIRIRREPNYIPKYEKKSTGGKKRQCLGILPTDEQCRRMVSAPARLCERCRERNKSL